MTDCPNCEYHKNRAARWRAEAYKQAGHDVIELPWVGLTDEEQQELYDAWMQKDDGWGSFYTLIEAKLRSKNT